MLYASDILTVLVFCACGKLVHACGKLAVFMRYTSDNLAVLMFMLVMTWLFVFYASVSLAGLMIYECGNVAVFMFYVSDNLAVSMFQASDNLDALLFNT